MLSISLLDLFTAFRASSEIAPISTTVVDGRPAMVQGGTGVQQQQQQRQQ
eukprot:CAMPEP_0115069094 /NCGR_PEP_ID=MMETSP0227-20121206/12365_1 /TAXON_ID=89957 /ORGANISM="Polarella glacialis, Strain CCMP 1383" /LENGTH=49 /DNA_ID= /DNA_START= /DNA_END= /DNA_ORIENTATION=